MDEVLGAVSEEGLGVSGAFGGAIIRTGSEMVDEALMLADEARTPFVIWRSVRQCRAWRGVGFIAAAQAALHEDMALGEEALNHTLLLRYRIFELGHWPLSLAGRTPIYSG